MFVDVMRKYDFKSIFGQYSDWNKFTPKLDISILNVTNAFVKPRIKTVIWDSFTQSQMSESRFLDLEPYLDTLRIAWTFGSRCFGSITINKRSDERTSRPKLLFRSTIKCDEINVTESRISCNSGSAWKRSETGPVPTSAEPEVNHENWQ